MKSLTWRFVFLSILAAQSALADVRMPAVFGSHMVLQRRKPVPVWGWADPGEKVTIALLSQTRTAKAGKDGKWRLTLDPLEAGGPHQLTVKGRRNAVQFDDVLVGEVWICSGQSNMEWPLSAAANGRAEIAKANYPQIRQLLVKKAVSLSPKDDLEGAWTVCNPETASAFTAVGYFFAKQLQQELNVPIGLINTSWGGTHSETWTSRQAMLRDPELNPTVVNLPANFSEIERRAKDRMLRLIADKQGTLPTVAEERSWADTDLADSQWATMGCPSTGNLKEVCPNWMASCGSGGR